MKWWHTSARFHPNKNLQRHAKNKPVHRTVLSRVTLPAVCIRETRSGTHIIQRYPYISNLLWEIECYISVLIRSERPAGCAAYNTSCSRGFIWMHLPLLRYPKVGWLLISVPIFLANSKCDLSLSRILRTITRHLTRFLAFNRIFL